MPLIKEKRSKRGVKAKFGGKVKAAQCITISGNQTAASSIAKNYLSEFPEVANWDVNVEYSQNKNNRWKIAQSLKDTFTHDKESLEEEDVNVFAVVVPDPNLVNYFSVGEREIPRYFMSNESGADMFVGRAKSHMPEHNFDASKDVKFRMEDEAMDKTNWVTRDKYGEKRSGYYVGKYGKGKSTFHYEEGKEDYLSEEEEVEEPDVDDSQDSDFDAGSPKLISLKDFFLNQSSKMQTNSTVSETKSPKKFKGKLFYDPDFVKHLKIEDGTEEEDFEKITELDTSDEKLILLLEDIDPLASKDWIFSNTDHLERITLINKDAGIILSLQPKAIHENMFECELKVSCLLGDIADVLSLFSECKTIFELSNMAQQLLGSALVSVRSGQDTACCMSTHKAAFNLLDIEIGKYEEEMKNTVIAVDDYCSVCFESGVPLDYCSCGEGFCETCWSMYLSSIKDLDKFIRCPGYDCTAPVPISILAWYLPNSQLSTLMDSLVENSVKTDYNVHRCARSTCRRITFTDFKDMTEEVDTKEDTGIKCVCGRHWCRWCTQEHHYPSTCKEKQEFIMYENKLREWKMLENKVEARTCPKCGTMWEKMWGCNFMHCTKCNAGFCWGCGKEHTDYNGICGSIKVPLEEVEILPFPTEELSRTRIESFNLHAELKQDKLLHTYKKDYNLVLMKFLTADRKWFTTNYQNDIKEIIKTQRGTFIDNTIRRIFNVCKQGGLCLLNSLLKKSTSKQQSKKIRRMFFLLRSLFDDLMDHRPTEKNWEPYLRRLEMRTIAYEKALKIKLA